MIIKIGEKERINPILQSLFPPRVPLLRKVPIIDIEKLNIIKEITTKENPIIHAGPKSCKGSLKLIVISNAMDVDNIEITPRTIEVSVVFGECLFGEIGGSIFILFYLKTLTPHTILTNYKITLNL